MRTVPTPISVATNATAMFQRRDTAGTKLHHTNDVIARGMLTASADQQGAARGPHPGRSSTTGAPTHGGVARGRPPTAGRPPRPDANDPRPAGHRPDRAGGSDGR